MRERLVRFRHAMHFLALLHRPALAVRGFRELARQARAHGLLAAEPGRVAQPAHRERHAPHRTHFHRHFTSTIGFTLLTAWLNTSSGSLLVRFPTCSSAR